MSELVESLGIISVGILGLHLLTHELPLILIALWGAYKYLTRAKRPQELRNFDPPRGEATAGCASALCDGASCEPCLDRLGAKFPPMCITGWCSRPQFVCAECLIKGVTQVNERGDYLQ